ncbi:solute carrier family 25, member 38 [Cryptococcus neoformans c8]|nr:solute carrier family 25, member 38 [Cryptococcus neoformans var. grubii AD1-83a]OXG54606.1 solute carrier family 25, member 38 [Cryptococcus neoformans var. grubii MW-RSA1955]OXG57873.1 solute carrier family 25, member 38 [Cryptococcus neoformans var. grubii CHC193]OXG61126.1 solute carrier family 25, member 38 [Cryptococcus neoformans var. grubii c8]OXH06721.1 solute carrier family 25, member 38 [Cryptococcus neoformans var. grubii A5-35-17]OXH07948.1 solute carrier family 25, member 38 [
MTPPSASPPATSSKVNLQASHHLLSGALSGLSSAVVLQPLDLLKTRLQQSQGDIGSKRQRLRGVVNQVIKDDGISGLWRGTIPTLVRNVPGVAVYFYSLSAIRNRLSAIPYFSITVPVSENRISTSSGQMKREAGSRSAIVKLSSGGNLLAGAVGRTSVGFVLSPITVIKARFESNRYSNYHSILGALSSLYRTQGVKGFYQGFTATAVRDAPYAGLYLVFYEKSKELAGRLPGVPNAALHSCSGIMAATLATIITSPADVIKTRMQVNPTEHPTLRKAIARVIQVRCLACILGHSPIRHTLQERGPLGFFSGTSLRISRKAASAAIGWTVYEGLLIFLRDRKGQPQTGAL